MQRLLGTVHSQGQKGGSLLGVVGKGGEGTARSQLCHWVPVSAQRTGDNSCPSQGGYEKKQNTTQFLPSAWCSLCKGQL